MAVRAAARIAGAQLDGDHGGSSCLRFTPAGTFAGTYHFDIGTAGSTLLVLQTVLLPLLLADGDSTLTIRGGTYNTHAPPLEFVDATFLPALRTMGAEVSLDHSRPGFYPHGGGEIVCHIRGNARLRATSFIDRGEVRAVDALAIVAGLDAGIARREIDALREAARTPLTSTRVEQLPGAGTGNALLIRVRCEHCTETISAMGQRGVRAEDVGRDAAAQLDAFVDARVPIGEHLADQLLLPLVLAGSGAFVTTTPSLHTTTNINVIRQWTGSQFTTIPQAAPHHRITLNKTGRERALRQR
jgi:RNA 3'-terminal phosphate cyclase (ATP)